LPGYLQQLDMESNGKSASIDAELIHDDTAPVTWGESGTNGQHAFFQMLHQGQTIVPADFIAVLKPDASLEPVLRDHHIKLLANCFAQSEALMLGRTREEAVSIAGERHDLVPHLIFAGNRPTNTILLDALTPFSLGALLALYEHKTFVQAAVWHINAFDQWGVELGKNLGKLIEAQLITAAEQEKNNISHTTRPAKIGQRHGLAVGAPGAGGGDTGKGQHDANLLVNNRAQPHDSSTRELIARALHANKHSTQEK